MASYSRLKSYLSNRIHITRVDNTLSDELIIKKGVPQGSILGPVLFILYVNDIFYQFSNNLVAYADDFTIIEHNNSLNHLTATASNNLQLFYNWALNNELLLNVTKTTFVHFHAPADNSLLIRVNSRSVTQSEVTKLLGVHIDKNLSWHHEIQNLATKMSSLVYVCFHLRNNVNPKTIFAYYYAHIYSRIAYSIIFWGSYKSNLHTIFICQKKIIRTMLGLSFNTSCKPYFIQNKILTVPCIYIYEVCKLVHENYHCYKSVSSFHNYNTRGDFKLSFPVHSSSLFEKSPHYSSILIFNALPLEIKTCIKTNKFLPKVKQFLLQNAFYVVNELTC